MVQNKKKIITEIWYWKTLRFVILSCFILVPKSMYERLLDELVENPKPVVQTIGISTGKCLQAFVENFVQLQPETSYLFRTNTNRINTFRF